MHEYETHEIERAQIDIHGIIDEAMRKKDRYVTIYFREDSTSISIYPWLIEEDAKECEA